MRKYETIDEGRCLRLVTEEFFEACQAEHKALGGRHPVQERDGYLCQFPDCANRSVEADHVRLKSAQGSDALWNRVSLCWLHHHAGKHRGRFTVYGEATGPDRQEPGELYFVVGSSGGPQRIWKNDRLLGTVPGVSAGGEIRCEADLRAWLRAQSANVH